MSKFTLAIILVLSLYLIAGVVGVSFVSAFFLACLLELFGITTIFGTSVFNLLFVVFLVFHFLKFKNQCND